MIMLALWVAILCCVGAELVIDVVVPLSSCGDAQDQVTAFLQDTYSAFYRATGASLPTDVVVVLPASLCQGESLPTVYSAGRVVLGTGEPWLLQYAGCGSQGLLLQHPLQSGTAVQFMVSLVQYLYGVFPETGGHTAPQFPLFHLAQGEVALTACTNTPVQGHFSAQCLLAHQVCG